MTESPEPLPDSIVRAHVILANEVFGGFQTNSRILKRLHPSSWRERHKPQFAIDPDTLLADAQESTLFVDQVQNALDKLTKVQRQVIITRLGLDNNGEISTFKDSGVSAEPDFGRSISKEKAMRIYISALRRLRQTSVSGKLKDYLPSRHPWVRRNIVLNPSS